MLKHCSAIFVLIFVFVSNGFCAVQTCITDSCDKTLAASLAYGDIFIGVEPHDALLQERSHGYLEHIISLSNSSTKSHIVTLEGPANSHGNGDYIRKVSRTVELAPSSKTKVSLFLPPVDIQGRNLDVIIDGKKQPKELKIKYPSLNEYPYYTEHNRISQKFNILLSTNVSYDRFKKKVAQKTKEHEEGEKSDLSLSKLVEQFGKCVFLPSNEPVEKWSDSWLAYTGYDGIVVLADDMNSMPGPVLSAIMKYVRCGGSLLVIGNWDGASELADGQEIAGQLQLNYIHFGICAVIDEKDAEKWSPQTWQVIMNRLWSPVGKELSRYRTIAKANEEFTIVSSLAIPVRGLFLLVLIFAILIGPVNLFVLGRMRKRMWMLWTVPLIAVITSAAVFGYAVYTEGLDAHAKTISITIFDGKTNMATTIGVNAFYCPLTPRWGLHYDYETELTPLGLQTWGGGRARYIDWTNDQHLSAGWIIGRVPAHFLFRKSQMTADPITITANGQNEFVVSNNLDVEIIRLLYADGEGKIHSAENIAPAGHKNLAVTEQDIGDVGKAGSWRKIYSSNWARGYKSILTKPEKYLKRGRCIAVLDGAPFVEDALGAAKIKNFESVVICLMEGSADAGRSK